MDIFKAMCSFSWSRLEHYISTTSQSDIDLLERVILVNLPKCYDGWEVAKFLINECKLYHDMKSKLSNSASEKLCLLTTYAHLAGQIRNYPGFRILTEQVETSLSRPKLKHLAQVVKWINHLGRLLAAFISFQRFCRDKKQSGYSFRHHLLRSEEDEWTGDAYKKKIKSWTGDLGLTRQREVRRFVNGKVLLEDRSVETLMNDVVGTTGNKARVHCEMQLLIHFSQAGVEECLDYFGCSKKSCWMCWQMISQNYKYSMKNTHRKLFPRWAFPFEFSPSQPGIAEGLRATYNGMLILIQDQIISQKPPSTLEPYPQTSARMTPAHQRAPADEDFGHSLLSRSFSSNTITVPDRFPAIRVPALYLPAEDDSLEHLRQVSIDAYECNSSADRPFMHTQSFAGKKIIFAFQLLTRSKPASVTPDAVEYQQSFWTWIDFHNWPESPSNLNIAWRLFYRPWGSMLTPNPHVLSIWNKISRGEYQCFPWRGDVFIIPLHDNPFGSADVLHEPFALDHQSCFSSLEVFLINSRKDSARGEYAKKVVEDDLAFVSEMYELHKQLESTRRELIEMRR